MRPYPIQTTCKHDVSEPASDRTERPETGPHLQLRSSSSQHVHDAVLIHGAAGRRPGGAEGVVRHLGGHQVGGGSQGVVS